MGLLGKLFGDKNTSDVTENTDSHVQITKEMVKTVLDKLAEETAREVIYIQLHDEAPGLLESKFSGMPYIPKDENPPVDNQGRQLQLLAQINMTELPENTVFPKEGILQFWVLNDDGSGLDFDNYSTNNTSRVIYFQDIDDTVTVEEVKEKYHPYVEEDYYFPISKEVKLTFEKGMEGITNADYHFDEKFLECWKQCYPENKLDGWMDLPDEIMEEFYDDISGFCHKMGGYPAFTQWDPRSDENALKDHQILLLQIDSEGTDNCEIMWGDSGVGNFFITKKDLENKIFSETAYSWDCY